MKKIKLSQRNKLIVLSVLLVGVIISYWFFLMVQLVSTKKYNDMALPNTYLEELDVSNFTYSDIHSLLDYYKDDILSKKIKAMVGSNEFEFTLKELGISIDEEKTVKEIKDYQKSLSSTERLFLNNNKKKFYSFKYTLDETNLRTFLTELKGKVDCVVQNGYFDATEGVVYNKGHSGFSLYIDENIDLIKDLVNTLNTSSSITLLGIEEKAVYDERYTTINTMTSSFVTDFMPNSYYRNINLDTALAYINGSVVEPGEVFSYCEKAGPFNKAGYVFYYEFVGNGVCQIATTTYNAALLGGLEIVKRYPHAKKSLYVDGGLDATVASYSGGWCVDMQFKNTYQYPIYIKAYSYNAQAHVEFWSNENAKEGKEYTTESVKIGPRGYRTFLHTFQAGEEIDVHEIATTWYREE